MNITRLKLNSYRSSKKLALQGKTDGRGVKTACLSESCSHKVRDTFSNMLALQKAGVSVSIFFYHQEGRQAGKKIKRSEQ